MAFGIAWNEHRRNDDVARIVAERRVSLVASCERGNTLRMALNRHILETREQASILIDYMRVDASTKTPPLDAAEREAIRRLVIAYEATLRTKELAIVNCEEIR